MSAEQVLEREQRVELPLAETFGIYARVHNLEAITPPRLRFRVVTPRPIQMRRGT